MLCAFSVVVLVCGSFIRPTGPTQPACLLQVINGATGEPIDLDWFSYDLFGARDPHDFTTCDLLESRTGLNRIRDYELIEWMDDFGYTIFLVRFNGTDEDRGIVFPSKWDIIVSGHENVLFTFGLPTSAAMNVAYTDLAPVNMTHGILGGENVTITCTTNVSEPDAQFFTSYNYETAEMECPAFDVTFADPAGFWDFKVCDDDGGTMTKIRTGVTKMRFTFEVLFAMPQIFLGEWCIATTNRITKIELAWKGIVWDTCG